MPAGAWPGPRPSQAPHRDQQRRLRAVLEVSPAARSTCGSRHPLPRQPRTRGLITVPQTEIPTRLPPQSREPQPARPGGSRSNGDSPARRLSNPQRPASVPNRRMLAMRSLRRRPREPHGPNPLLTSAKLQPRCSDPEVAPVSRWPGGPPPHRTDPAAHGQSSVGEGSQAATFADLRPISVPTSASTRSQSPPAAVCAGRWADTSMQVGAVRTEADHKPLNSRAADSVR